MVLRVHGIEEKNKFKHAVSQEEYEILISLVKGEFNTPAKEHTRLQKKKMQLSNFGEQNRNIQWTILRSPYYFKIEKGF